MKAFFSKRKDGGKSNSDSALYPPPSTTRRHKQPGADALDLAVDRNGSAGYGARAEPWDGKCRKCRKLMSRCLCYEDAPDDHQVHTPSSDSSSSRGRTPTNEKRTLLETLSGMHPSRSHSRLPIKTTQDRVRERRMKESNPPPMAPNFSSSSSSRTFSSSRSTVDSYEEPHNRFTQSCPDVKWRSSAAISSTMRLAHTHEVEAPQDRKGPPKNLLAYDSKKPSNRFKPARSEVTEPVPSSASGNLYIIHPLKPGERLDGGNTQRVWEL